MPVGKIEFRQVRDFGEIINATFAFVRQNVRPLAWCVVGLNGPLILLSSVLQTLTETANGRYSALFVQLFLNSLPAVMLMATVYYFIHGYQEDQPFSLGVIGKKAIRELPLLLITFFGVLLLTALATIFFIIPGIYMFFALTPVFIVQMAERRGIFSAIDRTFQLVSGKWWRTTGIFLVLLLIVYAFSFFLLLPFYLGETLFRWLSPAADTDWMDSHFLGKLISALYYLFTSLFSSLIVVALVFHYYSLVETKESQGLIARIKAMGTVTTKPALDEEEY